MHADVVEQGTGAVFNGTVDRNFEFTRQIGKFRMECGPLSDQFRVRARIDQLVIGDSGKLVRRGIADAIARRLDGVHFHAGEVGEDIGYSFKLGPVVLDVLAGGEVGIATIIFTCNFSKHPQLARGNQAIGNRYTQHRRMLLNVQAILQAQWPELVLGQLTSQKTPRLVAKLCDAFINNGLVVLIVFVHIWFASLLFPRLGKW